MDESADEGCSFCSCVFYLGFAAFALYLVRRYIKGGQFNERVSAKGKVAVVTGANTGIGYETAMQLNLKGAKVYMLCRSEQRAQDARRNMVKKGCDATRLIFEQCDLSKFSSIRACADRLKETEDKIDILVNNAAVMFYPKFELTEDGHEMTWQSNYLGPYLLTELLLPLLEKSDDGRIVNVSSKLHLDVKKDLDLDIIDDKKIFNTRTAPYNRTKLANVMHARELTRRLRDRGVQNVVANACHPGVVATDLLRSTILAKKPLSYLFSPIRAFLFKTERDGAQTSLYLALSKHIKGVSGYYFADCKRASENSLALNDLACKQLYDYSRKTTA